MGDLRVFISHTSDLATSPDGAPSFVATAIGTIAALEGFSVEEQSTTFAAEDQTSAEPCRRRLAGCDIYLGIIGCECGTQVKGDEAARSFVEFEFDAARELKIPRIVLMFDPQDGQHLPATQRQSEFRSRLVSTQEIVFERFANQAELRSAIQRAVIPFQPQTSEHVSCHIEWARPNELSGLGIDPVSDDGRCMCEMAGTIRHTMFSPQFARTTAERMSTSTWERSLRVILQVRRTF